MASISATLSLSSFSTSSHQTSRFHLKRRVQVRCCAEPAPEVESAASARKKPSHVFASGSGPNPFLGGISTSSLSAGLASLGFLETGYLTYLKLSGSEAFCPVGGGGCGDVLNSGYSVVFGVPLPLLGMVAYGLVAVLSLQQSGRKLFSELNEADVSLILLSSTTSMATASAYFLYLLNTSLVGTSCSYCLLSAFLSFSLLFLNVKDFGLERIRRVFGLELAAASIVVLALTTSYSSAPTQLMSSDNFTLERYETEIVKESSPFAVSLAKHLRSIGAKMYGAFWCSHCHEQKEMFGREAANILDYVECFPNGAGKGRTMAMECAIAGIKGFPSWMIDGEILSGEQDLPALAEASGFVIQGNQPS